MSESKARLDKELVRRGLAVTRSQAEDLIHRGFVAVDNKAVTKPGFVVRENATIHLKKHTVFVSRAGEKLDSVIKPLNLDFKDKTVLDVGSSTGGFTQLVLQHGAKKVIAVDVGTDQLHPELRHDKRIELHEKTDIRDFQTNEVIDVVIIDVSFISLRDILPTILKLAPAAQIIAMVKPQFEAINSNVKHKGVIKNDKMRRDILKDFEQWASQHVAIKNKADSEISGAKGNLERFYLLKPL